MSEKKRKRADEPAQKTKKAVTEKPRAESNPHEIRVSSLIKPKSFPPVIATTPGLCLPSSVQFQPYSKARNTGGKSKKSDSADLLLYSSGHKTLNYTGREDQPKGGDGLLRHYIGMFDPKTGELEVVEARKVTVRGSVRAQKASAEAVGEQVEQQATADLRKELGQVFGTKKAKKALVARVENAITPRNKNAASGADASETALMASIREAAASMPTREDLQAAVDGAKPVPKGNYDADMIQDVYDPEEIIGADVLNSIPVRDWQEAVKNSEPVQTLSKFVVNRVRRVGEHEESVKRLRILRYLYFLILLLLHSKSGKRGVRKLPPRDKLRTELKPAPDVVLDSLRRKFSDNGEMRKPHIDLLVTTCCVLACIIDSFELDTLELRDDLRLEQKQLDQYFREIGARTKSLKSGERQTTMVKLMLPLDFPKLRMQRRKN